MKRQVIPERLVMLRTLRALSQEDASDKIGISRETLRRLEGGNGKAPFPSTLSKLCAFYGVTPAYLLGLDDEQKAAA